MEEKRNSLFKKIAAIAVLAATIVMNMAMPVFAEGETVDGTKPVSLTLTKYEAAAGDSTSLDGTVTGTEQTITGKTPMKDVEFTVLKVADLVQKNDGGTVGIYYRLTADGATVLSKSGTTYTANQDVTIDTLQGIISGKTAADPLFAGFADMGSAVTATTGDNGQVKFTSDTVTETASVKHIPGQGLYLVVETLAPDNVTKRTSPFFVSLPMTDRTNHNQWQYDVYAYPKNATGDIEFDKEILAVNDDENADNIAADKNSAEANVGDVITFRIPFTMVLSSDRLTKWGIEDTMCKGLTFKKAGGTAASTDVTVQSVAADGTKTAVATTNYTVTETKNASSGETTVKIEFTKAYIDTLYAGSNQMPEFEVVYKAVLNENAVLGKEGNKNKAHAYYRNTSMTDDEEDKKTDEEETTVYTWGVDLAKKGESDAALKDVEFKLTEGNKTFKFKKEGTNGYYYLSDEADASETLVTDANGKLVIRGLKSGTYDLTETKTASGYVLLKEPVTIVINGSNTDGTATATVNGTAATMTADTLNTSSLSALVPVTVVNSKGLFILPSTGGTGTALITMIGIVLVIISSALLIRMGVKKRRETSKN